MKVVRMERLVKYDIKEEPIRDDRLKGGSVTRNDLISFT